MTPVGKNIIIGLALGLLGIAGVLVIIWLTSEPAAEDVLAEGVRLAEEARAEEETAGRLEAEGRHEEAKARMLAAQAGYDRARDFFFKIYSAPQQEKNTRLTAAYYLGLIQYARGSQENLNTAMSLLEEVANNTEDPLERFESCRVIMSYDWTIEDFDGLLKVLRLLQRDRNLLLKFNEQQRIIETCKEGRDVLGFFADHPEFGLTREDITWGRFGSHDKSYWASRRLYRSVADTAARGASGQAAITRLFDWCVRNVVSTSDDEGRRFVTSPHERLYAGHGTAEERAWVLCALIEALHYRICPDDREKCEYEAMVLKVGDSTLVSAWDGRRACLFDMDMCLPVYGEDGKSMVPLDVVRKSSEDVVLNTGLEGVSYPYTSRDIRNARYLIPFNPEAAAFRQAMLLPNDLVPDPLVHRPKKNYRPLYEDAVLKLEEAVRRHFSRKVKEFRYPYKDPDGGTLELWMAPFELSRLAMLSGIMEDRGADAEEIKALVPEEREKLDDLRRFDASQGKRIEPFRILRRVQLEGEYALVARHYLADFIEDPLRENQKELLGDAACYMGRALLDHAYRVEDEKERKAAFEKAKNALQTYLEKYAGGRWYDGVRYNLALAYLELGREGDAENQLRRIKDEHNLKIPAMALMKQLAAD